MTWLTLSHLQAVGRDVLLRFRPDAFLHEEDNPVWEVKIEGVEGPEAAIALLTRFRENFVIDLAVEATELRVLGEMDDEETIIRGACVSASRVQYSSEELRKAAVFFERLLQEKTSQTYRQAAKIRDVRHFVADLIERAERKRSLSAKASELTEAQLSVLHRVLNRIDAT